MVGNGKAAASFFFREGEVDWLQALRLVTTAHGIAYRGTPAYRAGQSS